MKRSRQRLIRFWQREVANLQPSGLFALSYFRVALPSEAALHRVLWWNSRNRLPWLLWLPVECVRILHWYCLGCRRLLTSAVKACGEQVAATEGISIAVQRARISDWAMRWCIPPQDAYNFGLYRGGSHALNRIYPDELQTFHRIMNSMRGATPADYRLLFDKSLLSNRLAAAGVPVVSDIAESDGSVEDLHNATAASGPVFCKLRAGSRGESAFMAQSGASGMTGQTLAGNTLGIEAEVLAAWKTLTDKGAVLIQPYLRNHPLLQELSPDGESITLRVITRACDDGFKVWTGLLYVQAPGELLEREYWLLKIDAETGQAYDAFGHWQNSGDNAENELSDYSKLLMLEGQPLPFWRDIVRHSIQAHAELPRLWTIAWDWIVTPNGPLLLEGNAGWDLSPLQELGAEFVKIGCELLAIAPEK